MTAYRKRFVVLALSLAVSVMTIVLIVMLLAVNKTCIRDLNRIMRMITIQEIEEYLSVEDPNITKEQLPQSQITSILMDKEDGRIIELQRGMEDTDNQLVSQIIDESTSSHHRFGRIADRYFYYCNGWRYVHITIADSSYLRRTFLQKAGVIIGLYLVAVGAFLLISIWLSKYAVRPMEEAIERERVFTTNISHDLKTPLTVIKMNNSIIARSPQVTGTDLIQWTDSTDEAIRRMQHMIEQMMELSALESNVVIPIEEGVDMSGIVLPLVRSVVPVAAEKNITLISDKVEKGVMGRANTDYAGRIVAALLDNAVKYEPEGGEVVVALHEGKKGGAELSIRNRGSHIAPEDMPHIFDRFWRGDKARSTAGHGLGLPIAKKTAELMGTELNVVSGEEGTTFTVVFPL